VPEPIAPRPPLAAGWRAGNRRYLVLLFALEALIFYTQVADQIAPFYPGNYDQAVFYSLSYELALERFRARGWSAFLSEWLHPRYPFGVLFPSLGALASLIGGPNRTAMLSVNLGALFALQWTVLHVVTERTGRRAFGWMAVGLLLSCGALFNPTGGLYDYRIDFSALCVYGIWIALVLWSNVFRDRRRALVVGAVGILLVSLRFFTVLYLAAVLGGLLVAMLGRARIGALANREEAARRARNVAISGALTAAVSLPLLLGASELIYAYYGIGHLLGEEKYVRAREQGLQNVIGHVLYYPRTIRSWHVGASGIRLGVALLSIAVAGALWLDRPRWSEIARRLWRDRLDFLALGLAIVAPLAILTGDVSKSPVVGGIVVVPIVLAVVLVCAALLSASGPRRSLGPVVDGPTAAETPGTMKPVVRRRLVDAMAVLALLAGGATFIGKATALQRTDSPYDLERVNALNREIVRFAVEGGLRQPTFSIDRVVDYLNDGTLKVSGFETLHRLVPFAGRLGQGAVGIFGTTRDAALKLLEDSDVVVLTDPVRGRDDAYPMNARIREYWGDLWAWTREHREPLTSFEIFGVPHHVFVRPSLKLSGARGDWVTSDGLVLEADASHLAARPFIVLSGDANFRWLGGEPKPSAVILDEAGAPGPALPAMLRATNGRYEVVIDARPRAAAARGPIRIALTFDRFFVPSELGLNTDTRKLVVRAPESWRLVPRVPE